MTKSSNSNYGSKKSLPQSPKTPNSPKTSRNPETKYQLKALEQDLDYKNAMKKAQEILYKSWIDGDITRDEMDLVLGKDVKQSDIQNLDVINVESENDVLSEIIGLRSQLDDMNQEIIKYFEMFFGKGFDVETLGNIKERITDFKGKITDFRENNDELKPKLDQLNGLDIKEISGKIDETIKRTDDRLDKIQKECDKLLNKKIDFLKSKVESWGADIKETRDIYNQTKLDIDRFNKIDWVEFESRLRNIVYENNHNLDMPDASPEHLGISGSYSPRSLRFEIDKYTKMKESDIIDRHKFAPIAEILDSDSESNYSVSTSSSRQSSSVEPASRLNSPNFNVKSPKDSEISYQENINSPKDMNSPRRVSSIDNPLYYNNAFSPQYASPFSNLASPRSNASPSPKPPLYPRSPSPRRVETPIYQEVTYSVQPNSAYVASNVVTYQPNTIYQQTAPSSVVYNDISSIYSALPSAPPIATSFYATNSQLAGNFYTTLPSPSPSGPLSFSAIGQNTIYYNR